MRVDNRESGLGNGGSGLGNRGSGLGNGERGLGNRDWGIPQPTAATIPLSHRLNLAACGGPSSTTTVVPLPTSSGGRQD